MVTEQGAVALQDVPLLQRQVASLCHHHLCSGMGPEPELPERDVLIAAPCGGVSVVTCCRRVRLREHPALLSLLLDACGRAVRRVHSADAWGVD